jgi:hypothetical protein
MNTNTNTNSAAFTRLLDDLLWLHARGCSSADGLREAVDAMIADYTDDPDHYSDGHRTAGQRKGRNTMTTDDINARDAELPAEVLAALEEAERALEVRDACTIGALFNSIRSDRAAGTYSLLRAISLACELIRQAVNHPSAVGDEFVEEAYGLVRGTLDDVEEVFFPAPSAERSSV